jgi:hypothetical protein
MLKNITPTPPPPHTGNIGRCSWGKKGKKEKKWDEKGKMSGKMKLKEKTN